MKSLFQLIVSVIAVGAGVQQLLAVFFPSFRDEDFGKWEIDATTDRGSRVNFLGRKFWFREPKYVRVASGEFSERTARIGAFVIGLILIAAGLVGVLDYAGTIEVFG